MNDIECPYCKHEQTVEGEDLPDCACDDVDYDCDICGKTFQVGWFATAEVR